MVRLGCHGWVHTDRREQSLIKSGAILFDLDYLYKISSHSWLLPTQSSFACPATSVEPTINKREPDSRYIVCFDVLWHTDNSFHIGYGETFLANVPYSQWRTIKFAEFMWQCLQSMPTVCAIVTTTWTGNLAMKYWHVFKVRNNWRW